MALFLRKCKWKDEKNKVDVNDVAKVNQTNIENDVNSSKQLKPNSQSQNFLANIKPNNNGYEHQVANFNPLSKPVTNLTRYHLLQSPVFTLEYEFYEFIKQRLHMQAKYCGLE